MGRSSHEGPLKDSLRNFAIDLYGYAKSDSIQYVNSLKYLAYIPIAQMNHVPGSSDYRTRI